MADNSIKKTEDLSKAFIELEKTLEEVGKTEKKTLDSIDRKAQKAQKSTDDLTESFEKFNKVIKGTSAKGLSETLTDMPNYIKGISKLTSSYSKFTQEAGRTSDMLKTMGISFNKTMKDLESKSGTVSKSMSALVSNANKFASVKDNLASIPKQLKKIQDAMGVSPDIKVGSLEKLTSLVDKLEDKLSAVDFKSIKGNLEKIGSGEEADSIVKNIQDKLKNVKITSPIIDGEEIAKKAVEEISKGLTGLGNISPGDDLIDTFLSSLKELSSDASFSKVMDQYKAEIKDFQDTLAKPGATYEEVSNKMISITGKLDSSMSGFFENFNKKASILEDEQKIIIKQQEELSDRFKEGYKLTFFTDEAISQFQGVLSQMSANAYTIQANNIIPDDQLLKAKEMQQALRNLVSLNEENKKIQEALSSEEVISAEALAEIVKSQKENVKAMQIQVRHMKDLEKTSESYAKHIIEASESGFGQREADGFRDKLFGISGSLKKMGGDMGTNSAMGNGLSGLGDLAGKFGGKLSMLAFPLGVLSGVVSLGKMLIDIQSKYAGMGKEIINTGALMGMSSAEVGDAMDDLDLKATNLAGNLSVKNLGGGFALTRAEITGVVSALNEAGLKTVNLKSQMKDVATSAGNADNAFAAATEEVSIFAFNLGISKGQVAGLFGDMAFKFGSTMGSLKDSFTEITAAAQGSGMTTNRFLATVQTATAGMALYENQVRDVAKMVSSLGKNTNLTGEDIGVVSKNVSEFARNEKGLILSLTQMSDAQHKGLLETIELDKKAIKEKIKGLEAKGEGASKQANLLKKQLELNETFGKEVQLDDEGNMKDVGNAAYDVRFQSPEVQAKLFSVALEKTLSLIGDNKMSANRIATQSQIDPKVIELAIGKGLSPDDIAKKYSTPIGDPKEQQLAAEVLSKKSTNVNQNIIDATSETGVILTGMVAPLLEKILYAVGALAGISILTKLWKSGIADKLDKIVRGGGGAAGAAGGAAGAAGGAAGAAGGAAGAAGGAAKAMSSAEMAGGAAAKTGMFSKVGDFFKDKASKIAGAVAEKAAPATELAGKAVGGVGGTAKGVLGGAKIAGGAMKGAKNVLGFLKVVPLLGTIIGAGLLAKDAYDIVSKVANGEEVGKGDMLKLGMSALTMVPAVGTVAAVANLGMDLSGGYDALNKSASDIPKPGEALADKGVPKPGASLADGTGLADDAPSASEATARSLALYKQQAAAMATAGGKVTNNNNFNINGGDKDEIVKIILETLQKYGNQRS